MGEKGSECKREKIHRSDFDVLEVQAEISYNSHHFRLPLKITLNVDSYSTYHVNGTKAFRLVDNLQRHGETTYPKAKDAGTPRSGTFFNERSDDVDEKTVKKGIWVNLLNPKRPVRRKAENQFSEEHGMELKGW